MLWCSGALSSDQRVLLTQRPVGVCERSCSFHSSRRTWSVARAPSRTTWNGIKADLGVGDGGADGALVLAAHVDRDRPDRVLAVAELVEEAPAGWRCCGPARTTRSRPWRGRRRWSGSGDGGGRRSRRRRCTPGPARRRSSRWSATTRATIGPIVCQPTRSSRVIGANAICCASHATTSSKSRVCAAPGRAHGTGSSRTPQSRQRSRRSSHSIQQRLAPRSRWRQRLTRRSWISQLPAGLPALGAHPPAAPQTDRHDHALAGEADVDHGCAGQAEQPLECGGDAHVALLREPLTSDSQQPAPRAAARRSRSAQPPRTSRPAKLLLKRASTRRWPRFTPKSSGDPDDRWHRICAESPSLLAARRSIAIPAGRIEGAHIEQIFSRILLLVERIRRRNEV